MKRLLHPFVFACLALLIGLQVMAQTHTPKYISMTSKSKGYYEYLPEGYDPAGTATYPLILFMTGIGEFGDGSSTQLPYVLKNGITKLITDGKFPRSFTSGGSRFRFIVITPQFLKGSNPAATDMNTILNYIVAHYKVNTKRIYISGLSYGGGLSFAYPGYSSTYAARIAAIVPTASPFPDGGNTTIYSRSRTIAAGNVPVWATHNKYDRVPDSSLNTITYVNYINQSPAPNPPARITLFNANGHDAWTTTYNPDYRENGYNVYEWMLLHQKGSAPPSANKAPTVTAGSDKTITLPTNSVTLTASAADSDGTISFYSWSKVSGPVEGTITSPTSSKTSITGLVRGIYTFRVMAADNKSAKAIDDVKVTVNPAAGAKAIQVNIYGGSNAYSNTSWNNWSVGTTSSTNKTSSAFKYVDGASSTISAVLSATYSAPDNGSTYATGVSMAPAGVLRYPSSYTGTRTLTIKGLSTSKTYTIDLFASRNSSTAGNSIFTINGSSKTINAVNNVTAKATFTSIKPTSTGTIVVTINKSVTYNYLNGFIISETSGTTTLIKPSDETVSAPVVAANQSTGIKAPQLTLFPNPVTSDLTVSLTNNARGQLLIQVLNAAGATQKTMRTEKSTDSWQQTIPLAGLPEGTYYIRLQAGQWQETRKVLKLE